MGFKIRPQILLPYGRINEPIRIPIYDLINNANNSFLTNDFASGVSSITVQNITDFAINQVLFIGTPGNQDSEIIKTHSATAPTGSTVTLASTTTQPHSNSDSVYILPFDQVEISYSLTTGGAKSVITTMTLDVDKETRYNDVTVTSGYYFARFKNSITSTFSDYTGPIPVGSYAINTAGYVIDAALSEINRDRNTIISDEYAFQQLNNGQMEVLRELKRWSWMQVFGATQDAAVGSWKVALPTDIDDSNTNKSIYNFSIGSDQSMVWVDKEEWDRITQGVSYSTLAYTLTAGDSILKLTDSSDFDASGSVQLAGYTFAYTANDKSTGYLTLTAVSAHTVAIGYDCFQGASLGTPRYYTIHTGYIWYYPVVDSNHDKLNYSMDYYSQLVPLVRNTDTIVVPDPVMLKDYLIAKFIKRINSGEDTTGSIEAMKSFDMRLKIMKKTETMNHKIIMKPRYNDYSKMMTIDGDSKVVRTQGFV